MGAMSQTTGPRIVYLTAGAAGMICGSCLRDNSLVAEMLKIGGDVTLIPTYTPVKTDGRDVSLNQIFFGGINVYLQERSGFFRKLPRFLDRWLDRPTLIRRVASGSIETDAKFLGSMTVSMLKGERGNLKKEVDRLIDWLDREPRPDVIVLSNLLIGGIVPAIRRRLGVPVIVTLQGDDLFLDGLIEPFRSQAIELLEEIGRDVAAFITFSRYYADLMSTMLKLDRSRFYLLPLGGFGIDLFEQGERRLARSSNASPTTIGYLARIAPEKGLHLLAEAFVKLKSKPEHRDLKLIAAGWIGGAGHAYLEDVKTKLQSAGYLSSFDYRGEVDRQGKLDLLNEADVFCVPTVYRDPKGLFAVEAMAAGLPVVLPAHGAFPELLESTGGGLPFRPLDVDDLADQLGRLLSDSALRAEFVARSRSAIATHQSGAEAARRTIELAQEVCSRARSA
jgi:glycosyltransferase involved in cell wall biosynthesis